MTPTPPGPTDPAVAPSRRTVLRAAAVLAGGGALAACGGSDTAAAPAAPPASGSPASSSPAGGSPAATPSTATSAAGTGSASATGAGPAAGALVPAAEVPVGSGVILGDEKLVVTQPEKGTFKAFSSICTHQACPVSAIDDSGIRCACHNSSFSLTDGSPQGGPAQRPLPAVGVAVRGGSVVRT